MSYSKLHASIVNSSLWVQPDATRLLFITLLALCDADGVVYGSRGGLARLANINPDAAERAWGALLSPDVDSSDRMRAPEHEGRRIEEVSGGFRLLNFGYYRGLRNDDDRRQQNRHAQERFRAKSAAVSRSKPDSAQAEAEAEAEERKDHVPPSEVARARFERFWDAYPRKTGKDAAWKEWLKRSPSNDLTDAMIGKVHEQRASTQWLKDAGEYIPHPRTWLHQGRWQDEISIAPAPALMSPEEREQRRNAAKYGAGGAR